jgi:hypothetical protein
VQRSCGGTHGGPRGRRCGRRLAEAAERSARECREGEDRWLPPQDLRSRDRRQRHRRELAVGPRLIRVDLQEDVTDAQGRAFVMGDDDLDLLHVGHDREADQRFFFDLSRFASGLLRCRSSPGADVPVSSKSG